MDNRASPICATRKNHTRMPCTQKRMLASRRIAGALARSARGRVLPAAGAVNLPAPIVASGRQPMALHAMSFSTSEVTADDLPEILQVPVVFC
jgi:hypothetical protein